MLKFIAPKEVLNEGLTANLHLSDNAVVILNNVLVLHSVLVLFQATTLNVAINSNNKALLTIMMSNNVSSVISDLILVASSDNVSRLLIHQSIL
jgi:hypothetical protein